MIEESLSRIAYALERIASVLEARMPTYPGWGTLPNTNPFGTPAICGGGLETDGRTPSGSYSPPPVSYPDYSEPRVFSCGVESSQEERFGSR